MELWTADIVVEGRTVDNAEFASQVLGAVTGQRLTHVEPDGIGGWMIELTEEMVAELDEDGWIELEGTIDGRRCSIEVTV